MATYGTVLGLVVGVCAGVKRRLEKVQIAIFSLAKVIHQASIIADRGIIREAVNGNHWRFLLVFINYLMNYQCPAVL